MDHHIEIGITRVGGVETLTCYGTKCGRAQFICTPFYPKADREAFTQAHPDPAFNPSELYEKGV